VAFAGVSAGSHTKPSVYGGVEADNRPRQAPPPDPANDPNAVEGRLLRMELPEGPTDRPAAGYLYFPRPLKAAGPRLEYTLNGERRELALPAK
jgi:hypothetical protein